MPKLTLQNESDYSRNLLEAGQMPIWFGGKSSLDISPLHFVIHERAIFNFCRTRRQLDGMLRVLVTDDNGACGTMKPALVSKAIRDGHFGKEAQDFALDKDDPSRVVARQEAEDAA